MAVELTSIEIDTRLKNAEQSIRQLKEIKNAGSGAETSFTDLAKKIAGFTTVADLAVSAGKALIKGIKDLAVESVQLAASFEKSRMTWGVLVGDAKKGEAIFKELYNFAARTPLSFQGAERAAQTLKGMGVATEDLIGVMGRLGDVAMGDDAKLQRVSLVYGQVVAKGKADTRDLWQFVDAGVPIVNMLAKAMDVTAASVLDLVSKGKVGFSDLEEAIRLATDEGGQFHEMMDKTATTTSGKWSAAVDNFKGSLADLGKNILPIVNAALDAYNEAMDIAGTKRLIADYQTGGYVPQGKAEAISFRDTMQAEYDRRYKIADETGNYYPMGEIRRVLDEANRLVEAETNKETAQAERTAWLDKAREEAYTPPSWRVYRDEAIAGLEADFLKIEDRAARDAYLGLSTDYVDKEKEDVVTKWQEFLLAIKPEKIDEVFLAKDKTIEELKKYRPSYGVPGTSEPTKEEFDQALAAMLWEESKGATAEPTKEEFDQALAAMLWEESKGATAEPTKEEFDQALAAMLWGGLDAIAESADAKRKRQVDSGWLKTYNQGRALEADARIYGLSRLRAAEGEAAKIEAAERDRAEWQINYVEGRRREDEARIYKGAAPNLAEFANFGTIGAGAQKRANMVADYNLDYSIIAQKEIDGLLPVNVANQERLSLAEQYIESLYRMGATTEDVSTKEGKALSDLIEYWHRLKDAVDAEDYARTNWEKDYKKGQVLEAEARVYGMARIREQEYYDQYGISFKDWSKLKSQAISESNAEDADNAERYANAMDNLSNALATMGMNTAIDGFKAIGEAMASGADATETMGEAFANLGLQILNQLPMMFLSAGLQAIGAGNIPVGLGLIAAAGITGIGAGAANYSYGQMTANATGGIYGNSTLGSYQSGVYNSPQYFAYQGSGPTAFAKGAVFGEADAELLAPVKRMSNGNMGIEASGLSRVSVVVNNYATGTEATTEETVTSDGGRQVIVTVKRIVKEMVATGDLDSLLARGRIPVAGVRR